MDAHKMAGKYRARSVGIARDPATGPRVRVTEKENGATVTDRRYLWAGLEMAQEREAGTNAVRRRYYRQGFEETDGQGGWARYYYLRDHLAACRPYRAGGVADGLCRWQGANEAAVACGLLPESSDTAIGKIQRNPPGWSDSGRLAMSRVRSKPAEGIFPHTLLASHPNSLQRHPRGKSDRLLGSVREVVDAAGAVRARYEFGPWGGRTKISGDVEADFGYTGHWTHAGSGMVLAPFREYDPETARWLSRDPIEEAGGLNLYGYVANNPMSLVDPLGLDVTVGLYEGAGGFGHIGVGVNTGTTCGFYPKKTGLGVVAGKDTPGEWKQDTAKQIKNVTIKTTPEQDAAVQKHLDAQKQNSGNYNLYNRNCATQAGEALKAGGIKVPDTIKPKPFIEGVGK